MIRVTVTIDDDCIIIHDILHNADMNNCIELPGINDSVDKATALVKRWNSLCRVVATNGSYVDKVPGQHNSRNHLYVYGASQHDVMARIFDMCKSFCQSR